MRLRIITVDKEIACPYGQGYGLKGVIPLRECLMDAHTPDSVCSKVYAGGMCNVLTDTLDRVFGLSRFDSKLALESVKKGTAPGLYVKEGDTTTPWEIYSQVLKSRINTFHPPRWPTLPEWDPPPRSVETESERRHRLLEKERLAVAEEREMRKYAREQYESHHAAWSDLPYIGDE